MIEHFEQIEEREPVPEVFVQVGDELAFLLQKKKKLFEVELVELCDSRGWFSSSTTGLMGSTAAVRVLLKAAA